MVDLRPLTMGEILDRSASIWRIHWKALFKLYLGFQLGAYILMKGWELTAKRYFPISRGGSRMIETLQADPAEALRQFAGSGLVGFAVIGISVGASYFFAVAATRYVFPHMVAERANLGDSVRFAWRKFGTTFGFLVLMALWSTLILMLLMIPGGALIAAGALSEDSPLKAVLLVLGGLLVVAAFGVTLLWFLLRFMLSAQVLALEEVDAVGVFRRSNELSSGRVGPGFLGRTKVRLTIVFTVIAIVVYVVSLVFSIPHGIVQFIYANPFDPARNPDAIPVVASVPTELLQVLAQTVITPLLIVFDIVFYADMRVRREGLDLELKLKEAQA